MRKETKTKICARCKKRKYTNSFYKSYAGKFASYCHKCHSIRSEDWRLSHLEQSREASRKANKKYRRRYTKSIKKYCKNNPEKRYAKEVIHSLIRTGKIVKEPCSICGNLEVHAHHPDYSKPKSIIWLCPIHHKEEHKRLKQIKLCQKS